MKTRKTGLLLRTQPESLLELVHVGFGPWGSLIEFPVSEPRTDRLFQKTPFCPQAGHCLALSVTFESEFHLPWLKYCSPILSAILSSEALPQVLVLHSHSGFAHQSLFLLGTAGLSLYSNCLLCSQPVILFCRSRPHL
jgi:hypothetical protein